jgi:hypothetical protein
MFATETATAQIQAPGGPTQAEPIFQPLEADAVDLAALSDDELAERHATLNRQWRPLKTVMPAPLSVGRAVNPLPLKRKHELGVQICSVEIEQAARRQRTAEAELVTVQRAIAHEHDDLTQAEAKAKTEAARQALKDAELAERRATYAAVDRANRLHQAEAAVQQAEFDQGRWTRELAQEQQRLDNATVRVRALGYETDGSAA